MRCKCLTQVPNALRLAVRSTVQKRSPLCSESNHWLTTNNNLQRGRLRTTEFMIPANGRQGRKRICGEVMKIHLCRTRVTVGRTIVRHALRPRSGDLKINKIKYKKESTTRDQKVWTQQTIEAVEIEIPLFSARDNYDDPSNLLLNSFAVPEPSRTQLMKENKRGELDQRIGICLFTLEYTQTYVENFCMY